MTSVPVLRRCGGDLRLTVPTWAGPGLVTVVTVGPLPLTTGAPTAGNKTNVAPPAGAPGAENFTVSITPPGVPGIHCTAASAQASARHCSQGSSWALRIPFGRHIDRSRLRLPIGTADGAGPSGGWGRRRCRP
ncbi:hypothetical protein [Streptomyces sp. NPDC091268]|uniref:hypothetical protein n=1 Tax=Streptomyces sp. NPDC091268 TaxID=3365979 RepID=UPI0038048595